MLAAGSSTGGPEIMASEEHLNLLQQGVEAWNAWRIKEPLGRPDLRGAYLGGAYLNGGDFRRADLGEANLGGAFLNGACLFKADVSGAHLREAHLRKAELSEADLTGAQLSGARMMEARLKRARLDGAVLTEANLRKANLGEANLSRADLTLANLDGADLRMAKLSGAYLSCANLSGARLNGADLRGAILVETNLANADLTGCCIYGVSVWNVKLNERTEQKNLIISAWGEPEVAVDNIEVAQFVYLLLHDEKIRDVIDTVGRKGVLLLGRFTEGRIAVLERLRDELRKRGYLPIVFNFDKPETKDFTETVRLLAGLSHFVIADVTNPKSAPLELQATVPEIMVPFQPIIEEGEEPFAMLRDLWIKHRDWVFEPVHYSSLDALVGALDKEIIGPAEVRFDELVVRKAEKMRGRHV